MTEQLRRRGFAAAILAAALIVAACGSSASPTPSPTTAPTTPAASPAESPAATESASATESPEATEAPSSAEPSASPGSTLDLTGLAQISKFKAYKTVVKVTGIAGAGDIAVTTTKTSSPDASQVDIAAAGQQIGIIKIVGKGAWMKQGTADWLAVPAATADQMLSGFSQFAPDLLLGSFNVDKMAPALVLVGTETKNGVQATHMRIDAAKLATLPDPDGSGIPKDLVFDIWLAPNNEYIAAVNFNATLDIAGTPTPVTMIVDVSSVDDPALTIKAPK